MRSTLLAKICIKGSSIFLSFATVCLRAISSKQAWPLQYLFFFHCCPSLQKQVLSLRVPRHVLLGTLRAYLCLPTVQVHLRADHLPHPLLYAQQSKYPTLPQVLGISRADSLVQIQPHLFRHRVRNQTLPYAAAITASTIRHSQARRQSVHIQEAAHMRYHHQILVLGLSPSQI